MTPERLRAELDRLRALDSEVGDLARMAAETRRQLVEELAHDGRTDAEIGAELGMAAEAVRSLRRRAGIAPARGPGRRPSEDGVGAAHARGLTVAQIAEELGIRPASVRQQLHRLGLRAHRER